VLEKLLFKKIELWVLLALLLLAIMGSILFGWMVQDAVRGGKKTGAIGEVMLTIAEIPSTLKILASGRQPSGNSYDPNDPHFDSVTKGVISLYDLSLYKNILSNKKYSPKYFSKDGLPELEPLAIKVRVNQRGDEIMAIFDEKRNLVKNFNMNVDSLVPRIPAKIGMGPFHVFDDGSFLTWPYGGVGLFRLDICGNVIWQQEGMYHHDFSIADGKLYVLGLPSLGKNSNKTDLRNWNHSDVLNIIDVDTGDILKSISIKEIALANLSNNDPLFFDSWRDSVNDKGVLDPDFLHLNKVEVLPNSLQQEYPQLPTGALLFSVKHINLLFIIDPKTLEIVWFTHGHTRAQHDPKFIGHNKIAVFNNINHDINPDSFKPQNFSSIKTYDFNSKKWQTLYDMKSINGYTAIAGGYEISENGVLALKLTLQGRLVEIRPEGEPLFELISIRDDDSVFWGRDSYYLSPRAYETLISTECH